ncbi:MAG: hypothetical protein WBP93_05140 [Pyrinomonadaceae bacterium]
MIAEDAATLLGHIQLVTVDETKLTNSIHSTLENSLVGVDPASAFEILTYWLYICAENKRKITRTDVVERINNVGRFIAECAAHHREWFTSILPIEDEVISAETQDNLAEEFYQGVSARYDHILAELDVVRSNKLKEIARLFDDRRVVIIHAASGQGKTTLAYRYLHDFFPQQWRFRVQSIGSREHAASVALALTAHADAIGVPLAVYLDVSAQDRDWAELVKQLAVQSNIRVLVTIREEDWRRTSISGTELQFHQIELSFDQDEAREIYESLSSRHTPMNILDFEEAWHKFGESGPLMEFTHLVTQGDSLRERLSQQVMRLQNEVREGRLTATEMELLRLAAVVSAFEARLQIKPLAAHLNLPAPQGTLQLFEREYLLRVSANGSLLQGLHPIRSAMLSELLDDPTFAPWSESASTSLPFIEETDIESFLLYSFSRRQDEITDLIRSLELYQPEKWVAIAGVTRALIWLGMAEYVKANDELITDAFAEFGNGWSHFLDFDIAGVATGIAASWWKDLDFIPEEAKHKIEALQARQTDKREVFARAMRWLSNRTIRPARPATDRDWIGVGETLLWIGKLSVKWRLSEWLPEAELDDICDALPIDILATFVIGITSLNNNEEESGFLRSWFEKSRQRLVSRFRTETQTLLLEDDGSKLKIHFLFTMLNPESDDAGPLEKARKAENHFHYEATTRIELLRRLLPDREEYGSQGYGHILWEGFLEYDETVKSIPRANLPLFELTSINATFSGIANQNFRSETWQQYNDEVWQLRESVLACLRQLSRGLEIYFRRQSVIKLLGEPVNAEQWDECKESLNNPPLLPLTAVDEWGFTDEATSDSLNEGLIGKSPVIGRNWLAVQKYKPFLKAFREYTRTLSNFFRQAVEVMTFNPYLGRGGNSTEVLRMAESLGMNLRSPQLSTFNLSDCIKNLFRFQQASRRLLALFRSGDDFKRLAKEEQKVFSNLWSMWYFFALTPKKVMQNAAEEAARESSGLIRTIRLDLKQKLRRLSSDTLQIEIASESILWDETSALWMTIDAHDAWDVHSALPDVIDAIRGAVSKVRATDLRRYVLDFHYPYIVIVPLVRGKYISPVAWRISLPVILEGDSPGLSWWNYAQHEIPSNALEELRIESWSVPELSVAADLLQSTVALFQLAGHLRDFRRLPELDEQGIEQLKLHLDRVNKYLGESLTVLLNSEMSIVNAYDVLTPSEREVHPALVEARHAVADLHKLVLPREDFDGQVIMKLSDLIEWADRLEHAPSQAMLVSLKWTSDVLDRVGSQA